MIYTGSNARGAKVYDIDACQEIRHVLRVDLECGTVHVAEQPLRVNATGDEIAQHTIKFAQIYAIAGDEPQPVLFHCYGRK